MPLMIEQCSGCGTCWFPARYCCPQCGDAQWRQVAAGLARVAQATVVRARISLPAGSDLHLASVQLQEGPVVIACTEVALAPGTPVMLSVDAQQRVIACPVPDTPPE